MPDSDKPRFQGIADPKCRCTPARLCRFCSDNDRAINSKIFRGKFREPWNDAVKKNNRGESAK